MSSTDTTLARIRELTGPEHELGFNPDQVDELIELVRSLDRDMLRGKPLPAAWSSRPATILFDGRAIPAIIQR
jgi:hypothetical protein